jgi:hypothetical protein
MSASQSASSAAARQMRRRRIGCHHQAHQTTRCGVEGRVVHQAEFRTVAIMTANALVVVQEIAAPAQDQPATVDLNALLVVRGMAVNQIDPSAIDQGPGKTALRRRDLVTPAAAPVDRRQRDVARPLVRRDPRRALRRDRDPTARSLRPQQPRDRLGARHPCRRRPRRGRAVDRRVQPRPADPPAPGRRPGIHRRFRDRHRQRAGRARVGRSWRSHADADAARRQSRGRAARKRFGGQDAAGSGVAGDPAAAPARAASGDRRGVRPAVGAVAQLRPDAAGAALRRAGVPAAQPPPAAGAWTAISTSLRRRNQREKGEL